MAKPVSIFVVIVNVAAAAAVAASEDEENIGVVPVFWPRCVLRLSWRHEFRNVAIETIKAIILLKPILWATTPMPEKKTYINMRSSAWFHFQCAMSKQARAWNTVTLNLLQLYTWGNHRVHKHKSVIVFMCSIFIVVVLVLVLFYFTSFFRL